MSVQITPSGTRGQRIPGGPVRWLVLRFMRLSHRLGAKRMDGFPVVAITTRGARSGELRTTPVMAFPEGEDAWLVVGSQAGAARHPAWVLNMARHPDEVWVEIDGRRVRVTPTSLQGDERQAAWASIVQRSSRFGGYQAKTDREIPVIRLRAAAG